MSHHTRAYFILCAFMWIVFYFWLSSDPIAYLRPIFQLEITLTFILTLAGIYLWLME